MYYVFGELKTARFREHELLIRKKYDIIDPRVKWFLFI